MALIVEKIRENRLRWLGHVLKKAGNICLKKQVKRKNKIEIGEGVIIENDEVWGIK